MVTKLLNSIEVSRVQEITQLHNEIGGFEGKPRGRLSE